MEKHLFSQTPKRSSNLFGKPKAVLAFLVFAMVAGCGEADTKSPPVPKSYAELVELAAHDLSRIDIGRLNLLCAQGLPGSETLDVDVCLKTLDQWADVVTRAERKHRPSFTKNPDRYDNSLAVFRAVNLALTLKQDLGCGYNMDLVKSGVMADVSSTRFFRSSQDLFLHGFIYRKTGSCSSFPVLMAAVGRRCGYPIKLVTCKGHLFCRWDDGNERFNLETANNGADSKPDAFYRSWPHRSTDAEVRSERYLESLTPVEELAVFSQIRAACLQEAQRYSEAVEAYEAAIRGFPKSDILPIHLAHLKRRIEQ